MKGEIRKSVRTSQFTKPASGLFLLYAVFVLLLLSALRMQGDTVKRSRTRNDQQLVPMAVLRCAKDYYTRLVRNADPKETTTFSYDYIGPELVRTTWGVSCDSPNQTAFLVFQGSSGALIQFSQSTLPEWGTDRSEWTVNDARSAAMEGLQYLRLMGWETPECRWKLDRKPEFKQNLWAVFYRSGNRIAALRIHCWKGVLLTATQDNLTPDDTSKRVSRNR